MPEDHESKQSLKGSGAVENGDSDDFQSAPVRDDAAGSAIGDDVSVYVEPADVAGVLNTENQEQSILQEDLGEHTNGVMLIRGESVGYTLNDVRGTEDGGKEDMFVDCPDELIVFDNREAMAIPQTEQKTEEKDDMQELLVHSSDNGAQVHDLMVELAHLRAMLEKTIDEKEDSANEHKEEKNAFMKELANLHHQLKALNGQQVLLNTNDGGLVDGLQTEEMQEVEEKISLSDKTLHDMMSECAKFVRNSLDVQSKTEESFREFRAILVRKDQEIEELHAKVLDEQNHIGAIANRILVSLAMIFNEEEQLDDSITGKMSHIEKNSSILIEKYNHFHSEIDVLRQCLTEVRSDCSVGDECGTTLAAARDVLLELKRNEMTLGQHLAKGKEMAEMANADTEKLRLELEQEKTKYANTKEKLSLAVTKGKALVQQRDSLKQSLAEKTNELEKCLTELQEKSIALEAAEVSKEELVRTENLASSLKEALSQKHSTFAQFEEILAQAAAPENLQSADILERIRWLVDERNKLRGATLESYKLIDVISLIDLPEGVSCSNLESRVSWLVESFSQAKVEAIRLQEEIARTSEAARNEIECLTTSLLAETQEKDYLREELEDLTHKYEVIIQKEGQVSLEKDQIVHILLEASGITVNSQEEADQPPSDVAMLIDRCFSKVREQINASSESSGFDAEMFQRFQTLLYIKVQDLMICENLLEGDRLVRSKLSGLIDELRIVSQELQALKDKNSTLQKDLERSEAKSGFLREKLSMAVKKGKGLVQERENMKKLIDEKTGEIEKLKLEVEQQESALGDCKDQISKLSTNMELIPKLEADFTYMKDHKDQLEQFLVESNSMLQRVIESIDAIVLPVDSTFKEPVEKIQWLSGYVNECEVAKIHLVQELEKLKVEASTLSTELAEAYKAKKTLEVALSIAENNCSQLAEEKRELEVGKTYVEQELQKALEEASSQAGKFAEVCAIRKSLDEALSGTENKISVLMTEKETAQLSKDAALADLEKVKEEVSMQTTKLAEAYRTMKSLEDALSQAETNVSLLSDENNSVQLGRSNLENEMMRLKEEGDLQASKLVDAFSKIKSLQDALSTAENNISELAGEKKNAEEEISALNSKLNVCMQDMSGISSSVESRSLEISNHLNNLQLLMKDETLLSLLRRSFAIKLESLKNMDLILRDMEEHFVEMGSDALQNYPATEEDSYMLKFSVGLDNITNTDMDNGEDNAESVDGFESCFRKTVEGFHFRNKNLADKVEDFSTFMDEFFASLLEKLQATRDAVVVKLDQMRSLKQKVKDLEMGRQAQESKIAGLENDITILLSACTDATQELEIEVENNLGKLTSVPELQKLNNFFSEVTDIHEDAVAEHQQRPSTSKYVKTMEKLLLAAKKVQALSRQIESIRNVSAAAIKGSEDILAETRIALENAIQERDTNRNRLSKLESDLEALQSSYEEIMNKLEDYQVKEDKLNEREAEISSLQNTLLIKEKEAENAFLSVSQVQSLYDKIKDIQVPFGASNLDEIEFHDSDHAKKLFYIVDASVSMQHKINLLSHEKEELQSTLMNQVLQIEHLKEEVEERIKVKQESENMKSELFEVELCLENVIQKLGGNDLVGDQKSTGVRGLLPVLEKLVMTMILESENSKANAQELVGNLLGSQKVVDELSGKVKLLEDSYQGRSASPDGAQERSIFDAPTLPSRSEITEIEDVGPIGKKLVAPAPSAAHVRTLRKGSNDHLAIDIDSESDRLIRNEESDEVKGHVFKSLNTSGLVPVQGKIIADRIDGIWVSGGRALMSRPRARLGLVAYWLFLHIWLLGTVLL